MNISAVLLRNGRILDDWTAVREGNLADDLSRLLGTAVADYWRTPTVCVAVGAHAAHTKCLDGLPQVDEQETTRLVYESAPRFFLGESARLVVAARRCGNVVAATAFDPHVVSAVKECAKRLRWPSVRIVSVPAVVAHSVARESVIIEDDGIVARVQVADGCVIGMTRLRALKEAGERAWGPPNLDAPLRVAWAAARLSRNARIPQLHEATHGTVPAWRAALAAVIFVLAGIGLVLSPIIGLQRAARAAEKEMRSQSVDFMAARRVRQDLERVTAEIDVIRTFATGIPSPLRLLRGLTEALPSGSAIVALTTDSVGGTLVLVSESMSDVVASLDTTSVIATPTISGPITHERLADRTMERATIRFLWGSVR